uniref:Serpentine receptor class gamma n=1 Tax=Meloidogyne enterolobii TaxID=390850 RepID=A0A6V7W9J6_MELEN|nr:unnamed protein product [Meloidogyne enterolobii]
MGFFLSAPIVFLANTVYLPFVISLVIGVPSAILYSFEVVIIITKWKDYNSSFFQLLIARAILNILNFIISFGQRFAKVGLFTNVYLQLPSWVLATTFFFGYYCVHGENIATALQLLDRLSSILWPFTYEKAWNRLLPLAILLIFILPLARTIQLFSCDFYAHLQADNQTITIDVHNINTLDINPAEDAAYSCVIFMFICLIINIATLCVYKTKVQPQTKLKYNPKVQPQRVIFMFICLIINIATLCVYKTKVQPQTILKKINAKMKLLKIYVLKKIKAKMKRKLKKQEKFGWKKRKIKGRFFYGVRRRLSLKDMITLIRASRQFRNFLKEKRRLMQTFKPKEDLYFVSETKQNILNFIISFGQRFAKVGLFTNVYLQLPSWVLATTFFFGYYCVHGENIATALQLLDRLSSILWPFTYEKAWNRLLPLAILLIFILPLARTIQLFSCDFYAHLQADNQTITIDVHNINTLDINPAEDAAYSCVIFMFICLIINIATLCVYKTKVQPQTTKIASNGLQKAIEKRLILYAFWTFVGQLLISISTTLIYISVMIAITGTTLLSYDENQNFFLAVVNQNFLVSDISTIVLPAWLLLWANGETRKNLFGKIIAAKNILTNVNTIQTNSMYG